MTRVLPSLIQHQIEERTFIFSVAGSFNLDDGESVLLVQPQIENAPTLPPDADTQLFEVQGFLCAEFRGELTPEIIDQLKKAAEEYRADTPTAA